MPNPVYTHFGVRFQPGAGYLQVDRKDGNHPHNLINGIKIPVTKNNIGGEYRGVDQTGKVNYTMLDTNNNIGVTELWGYRNTQEDRVIADGLNKETSRLSDAEWRTALKGTIAAMESEVESKKLSDGSCLCANVVVGNTVHTANVGDSTAYVVLIDKDGKATVKRLNELHSPDSESELEKIKARGGKVVEDRLDGRLAVSRAIGDNDISGISHEPDVMSRRIPIPEGGHAFLITACDGMTERMAPAGLKPKAKEIAIEEAIAKIVVENKNKNPAEISSALAMGALRSGSGDNISVIVTPITGNPEPRLSAVFDGHGSDQVSEYLCNNFKPRLENQLALWLISHPKEAPIAPALSSDAETAKPRESARPAGVSRFAMKASPPPEAAKPAGVSRFAMKASPPPEAAKPTDKSRFATAYDPKRVEEANKQSQIMQEKIQQFNSLLSVMETSYQMMKENPDQCTDERKGSLQKTINLAKQTLKDAELHGGDKKSLELKINRIQTNLNNLPKTSEINRKPGYTP